MSPPGIAALAAQVRAGSIPSDTLVAIAAQRVEALNSRLNAIVASRLVAARAEAAALPTTAAGAGVLAGVPFTAKDNLSTIDLPTTCGSRALQARRTSRDATAVARMRNAGAVLMGKTNCPEFALGVDTTNELFGPTRNPLGPWTAGGSSGGEAAAVASGMSAVGLGSDYGGSLRWPAQCCALVGLRPTVGRVPRSGEQPALEFGAEADPGARSFQDSVQVVGPIGRTVADVDAALRVIAGPDGEDGLVPDGMVLGDYRDVDPSSVEVGWATTVAGIAVHPEVAEAVRTAAAALSGSGTPVQPGVPAEVDQALEVYDRLRAAEPMTAIERLDRQYPGVLGTSIRRMLGARTPLGTEDLAALWDRRDGLVGGLARRLGQRRVLLVPVSVDLPRDLAGRVADFHLLAPSRAISLFGTPALSVPVSVGSNGAPVSVQVVGPAFREDLVLAIGQRLSELFPHVSAPEEISRAR